MYKRQEVVTAYIGREHLQVVVARSGELLLANLYRIVSEADGLYYICLLYTSILKLIDDFWLQIVKTNKHTIGFEIDSIHGNIVL